MTRLLLTTTILILFQLAGCYPPGPEYAKGELSLNSALKVAFKYYASFNGGELDAQSYMALSFGFVFM